MTNAAKFGFRGEVHKVCLARMEWTEWKACKARRVCLARMEWTEWMEWME